MHRFSWDLHYDPLPGAGGGGRGGGGGATGAVPHRTYPAVNSPWIPPGTYSVRLTADGHSQTQPIVIKMDPRVKITPDVQKIFSLTAQMEDNARSAERAYHEARDLAGKLKDEALIKQVDEIAPAENSGRNVRSAGSGGGFGAPPEPPPPPTLANVGNLMVAAVMGMQSSEMPPTALELQGCAKAQAEYTALMTKWAALKTNAGRGPAPRGAGRRPAQ